jgi:MoaA/NifB/PqqE/SkfB family radical SAM enzyme
MPFCYSPWTNVDISPMGTISPCCKFQHDLYKDKTVNINDNTIVDYKNSNTLQQIKNDFQSDIWPAGCERCQIEEQNGIESKRQLDFLRWEDHYRNYDISSAKFITASVAFGNTCNLTCITCGPRSSSKWRVEHKLLTGVDVAPIHFYKKDFVTDFLSQAPDIIHIDIPGGEPFLSGVTQQLELLQKYVDSGQSSDMSLHYTTNVTVFPDQRWWNLWKHFKEIDMQLSLDSTEQKFEYIRYPASWSEVSANINLFQQAECALSNLRLSISHTVSAYNIFYIPDFLDWCTSQQLPKPWLGRVHSPAYMRPGVWPDKAKEYIVNRLTSYATPDSLAWASLMIEQDDNKYFEEFCKKLTWHDQYRDLNFQETFPEMAPFII